MSEREQLSGRCVLFMVSLVRFYCVPASNGTLRAAATCAANSRSASTTEQVRSVTAAAATAARRFSKASSSAALAFSTCVCVCIHPAV